jgi:hypothetical protein
MLWKRGGDGCRIPIAGIIGIGGDQDGQPRWKSESFERTKASARDA